MTKVLESKARLRKLENLLQSLVKLREDSLSQAYLPGDARRAVFQEMKEVELLVRHEILEVEHKLLGPSGRSSVDQILHTEGHRRRSARGH